MRRAAKRTFKTPAQNKLARAHRRKARKLDQQAKNVGDAGVATGRARRST